MKSLLSIIILFALNSMLYSQTYSGGNGTSDDPYIIATKTDLKYLSENSGEWSKSFKQTADLTFLVIQGSFSGGDFLSGGDFYNGGHGFIPIGNATTPFTGTYDGDGHSIDSLYISRSGTDSLGFFGYTSNADIKNLALIDIISVDGGDYVGGLVGYNENSTISNCYSTGSVQGDFKVGGLVGQTNSSTISSSYSTCSVSDGGVFAGGLIGLSQNSTINKCHSSGSVTSIEGSAGGLVGVNFGVISDCYSTGSVSDSIDVGGLVGNNYGGTVINSYSTGSVSGSSGVGGLVGYTHQSGTISNSYSTGPVSGSNEVGGLFGINNSSTVSNSFWDTESSGQSSSAGGTGKLATKMKSLATFTNTSTSTGLTTAWDFVTNPNNDVANNDYWDMDTTDQVTNNGYPFLSWQNGSSTALPVVLSNFSVLVNDDMVEIKWETATEVNNYGFEIERKNPPHNPLPGGEQKGWVEIGFVAGAGNSNSPKSYSFTDRPTGGTSFSYRLKQIDNDGKFKYYDAITIRLTANQTAKLLGNYPNPFNPSTAIKFYIPNNSDVSIIIFDMLGKKVTTLIDRETEAGYHIIYWNGKDGYGNQAASGVYIYRLQAGDFSETKKMNLLK